MRYNKLYDKVERISKVIGKGTVYYQSAIKYVGMVNFLLILATFKATYELEISAWLLIPVGLFIAMIVGYIDYRFIIKHQIAHKNEKNNVLKEIREVKRILKEQGDENK